MGYQSRTGSPRNSGRGRGIPRHEKTKTRAGHKHRSVAKYDFEENPVATPEEVVETSANRLRNLGNQKFALSPFSEYFDDWLTNLKSLVSEFESSPVITLDEQYERERSQILSSIEAGLEEKRQKETSRSLILKSLQDSRRRLAKIEAEYGAKFKGIEAHKNEEMKSVSKKIDDLRQEMDRVNQLKTGIFRSVSKKGKEQRVAEATQKLKVAEGELALTEERFNAEQDSLTDEYDKKKQPVLEQIHEHEKTIESQEVDDSSEVRRAASESLVKAINSLSQRKNSSIQ
jgi:hypothetical protein